MDVHRRVHITTRHLVAVARACGLLAALATPVLAADSARAILDRARSLDETTRRWTDRVQRMTLTIHDANGGARQRDLDILAEFQRWPEATAPSRLTGEDTIDGHVADVIELRPTMDGMPYSRVVVWMDRADLTPRRLEFRDADGTVVKTLALADIRPVGGIPTPHRLDMRTAAKGTHTVVELPDIAYDTNLADDLFTQRALERGAP